MIHQRVQCSLYGGFVPFWAAFQESDTWIDGFSLQTGAKLTAVLDMGQILTKLKQYL